MKIYVDIKVVNRGRGGAGETIYYPYLPNSRVHDSVFEFQFAGLAFAFLKPDTRHLKPSF
jgi:hypothetical protein